MCESSVPIISRDREILNEMCVIRFIKILTAITGSDRHFSLRQAKVHPDFINCLELKIYYFCISKQRAKIAKHINN